MYRGVKRWEDAQRIAKLHGDADAFEQLVHQRARHLLESEGVDSAAEFLLEVRFTANFWAKTFELHCTFANGTANHERLLLSRFSAFLPRLRHDPPPHSRLIFRVFRELRTTTQF